MWNSVSQFVVSCVRYQFLLNVVGQHGHDRVTPDEESKSASSIE